MPSARHSDAVLTQPGRLRLYSIDELMRMPPPIYIIERFIQENSFAVVYGPSGVGKSFIVQDMLMSIGSGLPWQANMTRKGTGLYVSAEGRSGLGQRTLAWMKTATLDPRDVDVSFLPEALSLHNDEELDVLFERFEEMEVAPSIVAIDTLARCFEGDENKTEDMGRFIKGVDRIRARYGCSVIAVHHTGTNEGRERGNTALRAATDTMIKVMPGVLGAKSTSTIGMPADAFTILTDKQKDAPGSPVGIGRFKAVEGTTSCVVPIEWFDAKELQ